MVRRVENQAVLGGGTVTGCALQLPPLAYAEAAQEAGADLEG